MDVRLLFRLGRVVSSASQRGGGGAPVRFEANPCGICAVRSDICTSFSPSSSVFPSVGIITPLLPTHLNIIVIRTSGANSGNL